MLAWLFYAIVNICFQIDCVFIIEISQLYLIEMKELVAHSSYTYHIIERISSYSLPVGWGVLSPPTAAFPASVSASEHWPLLWTLETSS